MIKLVKLLRLVLFALVLLTLGLLVYGFFAVPDIIVRVEDEKPRGNFMYSLNYLAVQGETELEISDCKKYDVKVSLFNAIPIKNTKMTVSRRQFAVVSGDIFGLRLYTDGVIIVSTEKVETPSGTVYPAESAGLMKGDIILSVNGESIHSHNQLTEIFSQYSGDPLRIVFERDSHKYETFFDPVYSVPQNRYIAGLWVRDSAAGIGTMTFFEKSSGVYAGLGHAVCDIDTGEILPLYNGDIVSTSITGCYKGTAGDAGELCGSFTSERIGSLLFNGSDGVYGFLDKIPTGGEEMPVAMKSEVKTGKAQIVSSIDENGPKKYDIEIEKIASGDAENRNMIIKITDKALIEKTGGIVQGMSGSPIIQNGMLVGAITHVFVNEPQKGYAIFAEYMIQKAKKIEQSSISLAS